MTVISFLVLLLIAGVCGAIGQIIGGFNLGGALVSIAVGFIGALFGMWLSGLLGLPELFAIRIDGQTFPLIWSIIGSALFVALVGGLSGRKPYYSGS